MVMNAGTDTPIRSFFLLTIASLYASCRAVVRQYLHLEHDPTLPPKMARVLCFWREQGHHTHLKRESNQRKQCRMMDGRGELVSAVVLLSQLSFNTWT
jgi:hypothetical protein